MDQNAFSIPGSSAAGDGERRLVNAAWAQYERLSAGTKAGPASAAAFSALPGYRVLGEVHRGGQGVVYQAIQESTRRKMAIKVLREGPFAGETDLARFDREVDVLSRLQHPHIVAIHDRGLTAGHAYFVMDYIAGRPLDAYVAGGELTVGEVLSLFMKICDAVNFAHLRGVIHRDLKPGNIRIDEDGQPRILDFGLAKLQAAAGSSSAGVTVTGQFIGSLPWASPEQATGGADSVDVRSDVYSLGVILYQLLTGRFPYPVVGRIDDVVRHIAQTNPARPSTIRPAIDRDVDVILLTCLAKEPERRYQSAGELSRDIGRHLAHEPVLATSPSASYRVRKFVRRHRGLVAAAAATAAILVAATSVSIAFAFQASRALAAAEDQRALAEASAEATRQVARFQSSLLSGIDVQAMGRGFKTLYRDQVRGSLAGQFVGEWPARRKLTSAEVDAAMSEYDRITGPVQPVDVARRVLDEYVLGNGVEIVKSRFAGQPRVQAELLETLGIISRGLGLFDKAVPPLRLALSLRQADASTDPVALAESMSELAGALAGAGQNQEAESLHRAALDVYRARLGDRHPATIQSMDYVAINRFEVSDAEGARAMFRDAVALARGLPPDEHELLARVLTDYGGALQAWGDHAAAEAVTREALDLRRGPTGEESKGYADTLINLAGALYARREYEECARLLQRSIQIHRKVGGEESVPVATLLNNLGGVLWRQGDLAMAKMHYAEALAMYRRLLGDEHPEVASTLNNLAMMHQVEGDLARSGPMLREVLELRQRVRSADHPELALSIANLALQLEREGDVAAAVPLYRQAVSIYAAKLAPCHSWRVAAEIGLLRTLLHQENVAEMERLLATYYAAVEAAGADRACRSDYCESIIEIYEEKHRAAPDQGFDRKAAEWRGRLDAAVPATQTATPSNP